MANPFPKDFLWGAATASYQVEGGIEHCDWAEGARQGRVPPCDRACDHYHRFREDFDIARELGHNAHRLSIEWARIEPEEGRFDEREVEHYREVLQALRERGMEPLVTILHFTLPLWFSQTGGWTRRDAPKRFTRYAAFVADRLGDLATQFATLNEPMVVAGLGYIRGRWAPFYRGAYLRYLVALWHMALGHREAYRAIKQAHPGLSVGIVKHTIAYSAAGKNPLSYLAAHFANIGWTHCFIRLVRSTCDWIGLNYYQRKVFGDTRTLPMTDMGWKSDPGGIYDALTILARHGKPIYVAEAGCADARDAFRADYIRETVQGIERALEAGIPVRGFCYWSLLDNYEWAEGFEKRFGLVEVDYDTLKRTIRPSAYTYREVIRAMWAGQ